MPGKREKSSKCYFIFFCDECQKYYVSDKKSYEGEIVALKDSKPVVNTLNRLFDRPPESSLNVAPKTEIKQSDLIDGLYLPIRVYMQLVKSSIQTIGDLTSATKKGYLFLRENIGLSASDIQILLFAIKEISEETVSDFYSRAEKKTMRCPFCGTCLQSSAMIFDFLTGDDFSYVYMCQHCNKAILASPGYSENYPKNTNKRLVQNAMPIYIYHE